MSSVLAEAATATILIAEDNNLLRESFARILAGSADRYRVLQAPNGAVALDVLRSSRVDLILTDLDMPVMDGRELITHRNESFSRTPLVVMSGSTRAELMGLKSVGVNGILEKPFDFDEALQLIRSLLYNGIPAGRRGAATSLAVAPMLG